MKKKILYQTLVKKDDGYCIIGVKEYNNYFEGCIYNQKNNKTKTHKTGVKRQSTYIAKTDAIKLYLQIKDKL